MKEEFQFEFINQNSNDDVLVTLLKTASIIHNRKQDSLEWIKWKYFGSPFGNAFCLVAKTNDDKIVTEITFGCYQFILNNKSLNCLISYQTMVHPNYQKRGLFGLLTKKILAKAESDGIDLVLNFPNKASYAPFQKLRFVPINHIENKVYFTKKFSTLWNIFSLKKTFLPRPISVINKEQVQLFNELKNTISPLSVKDVLVPNRSANFIQWRYFTFPLYDYRIVKTAMGWCIVRLGNRAKLKEVQIMEIFSESITKEFFSELRNEIILQFKPNIILYNFSYNHPANTIISKLGFYSLPHQINFFVYALNKKYTHLLQKENWIITATEFHRY